MIEVFNTADMARQVESPSEQGVKFPRTTNVLLGEKRIDEALKSQLESLSETSGRSLHLC